MAHLVHNNGWADYHRDTWQLTSVMNAFLAAASETEREGEKRDRDGSVSRSETERLHYSASLVLPVTKMNPKRWTQQSNIM